mmetsp:Transcript_16750/g.28451  ORF Transcript_16750/g.28451 Transcript_16750/m.28451 type:complete len:735 (+) Transcript_16750:1120-3324(+)
MAKDPLIRREVAYNFPCLFDMFGHVVEAKKSATASFPAIVRTLTRPQEEPETRCLMGQQFHEIFRISLKHNIDPFDFAPSFVSVLGSDLPELQLTVLPELATCLNLLNEFFKVEIVGQLWEMEKFSLREAQNEPDIEKYTMLLWDVTQGIIGLENNIIGNSAAYWREIKVLYEQLVQCVDTEEPESETPEPEAELSTKQSELLMPFFMLNKLCVELIDNAFNCMLNGFHPVRHAAFAFICKMVASIASSQTRLQFINQMRQFLYFENTRSSERQIFYLKFCGYLMSLCTVKFIRQHLLEDVLKHAAQHVDIEDLEVFRSLQQQSQQTQKKAEAQKSKELQQQKWEEFRARVPHLQVATQAYFLTHTVRALNHHLTSQDEELALSLITIIDQFKSLDEDACPGALQLSDAAFAVDERISFNVGGRMSIQKKKMFQRQDMLKLQREKRLAVREQFEFEHEDASINAGQSLFGFDRSKSDEDAQYLINDLLKKSKYSKFGGFSGSKYMPMYGLKKVCTTTFGTTKRFAPEPGSIHSKSQQRVLNSFKKSQTGTNFQNPSASSSKLQIFQSLESARDPKDKDPAYGQSRLQGSVVGQGSKSTNKNNRARGLVGRSQSKSQQRRDMRVDHHSSQIIEATGEMQNKVDRQRKSNIVVSKGGLSTKTSFKGAANQVLTSDNYQIQQQFATNYALSTPQKFQKSAEQKPNRASFLSQNLSAARGGPQNPLNDLNQSDFLSND